MDGETDALIWLALAKWITDLGILWLVGVCGFELVSGRIRVRPLAADQARRRRVARHAGLALGLLCLATAARLYAQTYAAFGQDEPVTGELLRLVAAQTRWGGRWMLQGAAVALAAAMAALVMARARWGWGLLGVSTLLVVGTAPMTGHAMAYSGGAGVPMTLQVLHLLAAGVWLGTLFVMLSVCVPSSRPGAAADGATLSRLVDRFSPVALASAATVAGTGGLTAWLYVDAVSQLWATSYGRVLLLKTGLFGLTAALGAYNWRRVRPELGAPGGADRLRRSASAELLVAVVLLAVTGWLVHLPMPHE